MTFHSYCASFIIDFDTILLNVILVFGILLHELLVIDYR